ncbi:sigma-like protein [Streptomyces sp. ITFR-6]|uniref:sigma-like protein n=1 Tax=Streptomyces sp. ITFR-6 TaxID=3075197 RepID=UPI002889F1E2|nr:sigma-like protein [Streptomyces sp. ITFR-6]WNI29979.1 sigma-like protein [Streptomyces sp. ITFR-6]
MSEAKKTKNDLLKPQDNHASDAETATVVTQDNHASGGDMTTPDNHASGEEITTLDNHASAPRPS